MEKMPSPIIVCIYLLCILCALAYWAALFSKAGYSPWWTFLMLIPVVNIVASITFVLSEWPIERELSRLRHAALASQTQTYNPKEKSAATPLHIAARKGYFEVVEKLIEDGAEVNAKTSDGLTPLRLALANGHTQIAEMLRSQGAIE